MVELADAGVRYGERWIWRGASLRLTDSDFAVVIGPNGAGKSTLLNVLLGLVPLSEGRALVAGAPPRRGNPSIGYVPQVRAFDRELAIRGIDVVRFGIDGHRWGIPWSGASERSRRARVDAAVDAVDAGAFVHRRIGSLSGGEAQRVYLAQALVGHPRLLVLDEPFASLDLRAQTELPALVARVARERRVAVVLVAHDVNNLLPYADRIVCIAHGRIASGRPEEIVTPEMLSRIYGAQIEVLRDSRGRAYVTGPRVA
jgi:zinc/manganese transport system ATP-binding protein